LPAAVALPAKAWNPAAPPAPVDRPLPPLAAPEVAVPPLPGEGAPAIVEITRAVSTVSRPVSPPGKFLYHELAPQPVVVNPLTDSPFSPWDQYQMDYWNRYGGDLFQVSASPTSTWAYRNGVSDIAGFPDDATMKRQFDYSWADLGEGVLAIAFTRREDGVLIEADVAFNPHKSWTLDDLEATGGQDRIYAFKEVVLHELGHVWGLWHPWDEEEWVSWDSVMNYKPRQYYVGELFADDTAAVRRAFPPGVAIRDGLISSYVTVRNEIIVIPDYRTPLPSPEAVRAGGGFGLAGPIKIENVGTAPLVDPMVEVYLAPARLSFDGAVLIQRAKVRKKIPPGGTLQIKLKGLKVPRGAAAGAYYLAYFLRDPKDAYQGNNAAWSLDGFTLTVTR
jgi:matrixin